MFPWPWHNPTPETLLQVVRPNEASRLETEPQNPAKNAAPALDSWRNIAITLIDLGRNPFLSCYLLVGIASISSASAFLKLLSPSRAPLKCPSLTTTRSRDGMIIVFWPPAPDMKYAFLGTG